MSPNQALHPVWQWFNREKIIILFTTL